MSADLLIQPIPYTGESADSFLLRTAQLNKHSSVNNLFGRENLDFLAKHAPTCALADLPRFKYALQILNLDPQYEHLAFQRTAPTNRSDRKWIDIEIDYELLKYCSYSYCPKCLVEKPFFRKLWLLKPIYACPIHSVFLLDHCHQCGNKIRLSSGEISTCSTCTASLKDAPTTFCTSISKVKWFVNVLNKNSNEFFQIFTCYWLALDHFSKLDKAITAEELLKITKEYFINPQYSAMRLSKWINKRMDLAHPRVQLLPFLKHRDMFYDYIKVVEASCNQHIPNPQSKEISLKREEVRMILDVSKGTMKKWINKNFLQLPQEAQYGSYSSSQIERFLSSQGNQSTYAPQLLPQNIRSLYSAHLGIKDIAKKLDINYDTARKLVKTNWIDLGKTTIEGTILKGFSHSKLEEFDRQYVIASALAKRLEVNPTNLVEKLTFFGISPISGPHIDSTPLNIFTRSSTVHLRRSDIVAINEYQTRTGRRTKGSTIQSQDKSTFLTLKEAANRLNISPNKTAVLTHRGIITKDQANLTAVMIDKTSLLTLIQKLASRDYVHAHEAAVQLNCSMNWLAEYWSKSGFLEIHDLVYWKLIKRSELERILKIKEEYFTGVEASNFLNMHHSHITNLHKCGVIEPVYLGKGTPIRLFRRSDVSLFKEQNDTKLSFND